MSKTKYIIVGNSLDLPKPYSSNAEADHVAQLLDDGYTLVISWVVNDKIHHILSKDDEGET